MEKSIQKKIIKQIERLCEKVFRKGFQQGYYACENKEMSKKQVDDFLFKGMSENYSKVTQPHNGRKELAIDRLLAEIAMSDMEELRYFLNPTLDDTSVCHLFKFENVAELLLQIDDRIDIMEKCSDDFKSIEGINLIELWRSLYAEIKKMWLESMAVPVIPLNKVQEISLTVITDIVAQIFLNNGSDVDEPFLKNVEAFLGDITENYRIMSTEERWDMLKKSIA